MQYVVAQGIGKGRISAKGYGESQPVAGNDTDEGRQQNRRVVLHHRRLITRMLKVLGGKLTDQLRARYEESPLWRDGEFWNQIPTSLSVDFKDMPGLFMKMMRGRNERRPKNPLPIVRIDPTSLLANSPVRQLSSSPSRPLVTWLGHSAVILEIADMLVLLDPMMGDVPAPFNVFGQKRFEPGLPITAEELPDIDLVIMSHDHYDHLDYETVLTLRPKVKQWVTSLGVGRHLAKWGIDKGAIEELEWGKGTTVNDLKINCTPARHFSGRSLNDRHKSLWSSWVLEANDTKIFFNADSGYGPHFREIGEVHGPFDLALMECGQYHERWQSIHMMPEESVRAAIELGAQVAVPIHWGAFVLAFHGWTDPPERFVEEAERLGLTTATPRLGERFEVGGTLPLQRWWRGLE